MQIKGQSKTTKDENLPVLPQEQYLLEKEFGLGEYSILEYAVSKELIHLLRHGRLDRENDGAIEFWRIKDHLRNDFVRTQHWSDEMWKSTMARGGRDKKRFQYCADPSGQEILYLRALQGHSGRNLTDPSLQDTVNSERFLRVHLSHRMCNQFTLSSQIQD